MRDYRYKPSINGNVEERQNVKLANKLITIILTVCLILCALVYITTRTFDSANVKGTSMYPTINIKGKGDIAYFTYLKSPKIGDVIIVDYRSTGLNFDAIKRLIAKGGDTVCYYDGHLLVNGKILDEQYLQDDYEFLKNNPEYLLSEYSSAEDWLTKGYKKSKQRFENWCKALLETGQFTTYKTEFFENYSTKYANAIKYYPDMGETGTYVLTVPENFVYFLGDNRSSSTDCSFFGPLEYKYIKAKVDFVASADVSVFGIFLKELAHLFW